MKSYIFLVLVISISSLTESGQAAINSQERADKQEIIVQSSSNEVKVEENKLFPFIQGGKWGYIDQTGKVIISPRFTRAADFSEGLAEIQIGEKKGYIDSTGKLVIPPRFDRTFEFSEGLAAVYMGEKAGYIDKKGKI